MKVSYGDVGPEGTAVDRTELLGDTEIGESNPAKKAKQILVTADSYICIKNKF